MSTLKCSAGLWRPAPTFGSDHLFLVGATVRLSAFEIDFDRAIAYCYALMVEAPHQYKYPRLSDKAG
jgi:hypothetical protein